MPARWPEKYTAQQIATQLIESDRGKALQVAELLLRRLVPENLDAIERMFNEVKRRPEDAVRGFLKAGVKGIFGGF